MEESVKSEAKAVKKERRMAESHAPLLQMDQFFRVPQGSPPYRQECRYRYYRTSSGDFVKADNSAFGAIFDFAPIVNPRRIRTAAMNNASAHAAKHCDFSKEALGCESWKRLPAAK
jgi:hypothetical protein